MSTTIHPMRTARKDRGLSQAALAALSGIDKNKIVAIELGTRYVKIENLRPIAEALDVPMRDLLEPHQAVTAFTRDDAAEFLGVHPTEVKCGCQDRSALDRVAEAGGYDATDPGVVALLDQIHAQAREQGCCA